VRDTLNLIHDLGGRGVGVRNLADSIRVDSANPDDPMAQLAVVMLALFAQLERTYMLERVAHARAVAHGRQVGRPVTVDAGKLDYARRLREGDGLTVPEIMERTGLTRSTLYRHLPPRPARTFTAAGVAQAGSQGDVVEPVEGGAWASPDDRGSCRVWCGRSDTARAARCAPGPPADYERRTHAWAANWPWSPSPSPADAGLTTTPPHSKPVHPPPVDNVLYLRVVRALGAGCLDAAGPGWVLRISKAETRRWADN